MTDTTLLLAAASLALLPSVPLIVSLVMSKRARHEPLSLARLLVLQEEIDQMSESLLKLRMAVDSAVQVQSQAVAKIGELRAGTADADLDKMSADLSVAVAALKEAIEGVVPVVEPPPVAELEPAAVDAVVEATPA